MSVGVWAAGAVEMTSRDLPATVVEDAGVVDDGGGGVARRPG